MELYDVIYKATNIVNGKIYIGLTTQGLDERKYQHKNKSERSDSKQIIYKAIRKYGWDNFKWDIIDEANNKEELINKEIYWIDFCNSFAYKENSHGYNMTIGGESTNGMKLSDETKKKISDATKGEKNPNFGKLHSNETKEKIREKRLGTKLPQEVRDKFSEKRKGEGNGMYGKNHSEESKEKIRKAHIGKIVSDETKDKLSKSGKGRKFSEEHKKKISESNKGKVRKKMDYSNRCTLIASDIRQIRELHFTGWYTYAFLGRVYGVNETTISNIVKGKTWKDME